MDENENSTPEEGARKNPWPIVILVIAATLFAVWLVPDQDQDPVSEQEASSQTEDEAAPSLLNESATTAPVDKQNQTAEMPPARTAVEQPVADTATAAPAAEPDNTPGAQARALIRTLRGQNKPDYTAAYAEAQKQLAAGRLDDAYLLLFFAAREGHGESAMMLASQSDPAHFEAAESVFEKADPVQANKWYKVAVAAGLDDAKTRLQKLHNDTEQAASAGDALAQRAMLQWK